MIIFAERLKERAKQLGISNAEAARRAGLDERRYAHYVRGRNEPDLATVVRIAKVLKTTPNILLGFEIEEQHSRRRILTDRLNAAADIMGDRELEITVIQAEALAISEET